MASKMSELRLEPEQPGSRAYILKYYTVLTFASLVVLGVEGGLDNMAK